MAIENRIFTKTRAQVFVTRTNFNVLDAEGNFICHLFNVIKAEYLISEMKEHHEPPYLAAFDFLAHCLFVILNISHRYGRLLFPTRRRR